MFVIYVNRIRFWGNKAGSVILIEVAACIFRSFCRAFTLEKEVSCIRHHIFHILEGKQLFNYTALSLENLLASGLVWEVRFPVICLKFPKQHERLRECGRVPDLEGLLKEFGCTVNLCVCSSGGRNISWDV